MAYLIPAALLCFFAVVGVAEIAKSIKKRMLTPCFKNPAFIITCSGHDEQIEYSVRSLVSQADELCPCGRRLIILLDEGMDEETRSICKFLEHDIAGVTVCKRPELLHLFGGELQN